ncbi:abc transporter multidrug efflux pump [hydrocarbon metagenome]|uniref:Abc transporter multidrug efflux pump n=1 Tax=hydrocarbon metagenome TaxID=938273 RepID=A0A0W8E427_9ZZZZ
MLSSHEVSKCFGTTRALDKLSIRVNKGEIFGLVGPDGAGKTTFLRMVCNLIDADAGTISIAGSPASRYPRERLGYMPQKFSLYGDLTISENINFFASLYSLDKNITRQRSQEMLQITGLTGFENRLADNLSGGMKQKLALTSALMTRPELMVLDEPTYGVDPESRKEFWQILYRLNESGITILISTPYMDEAELCHRVALIDSGRLVACDSPAGLKQLFDRQVIEVRAAITDPFFFDLCSGVVDSSYYSKRFHLLVQDNEQTFAALQEYALDKGFPDIKANYISPSMEDVFAFLAEPRLPKQSNIISTE